MKIPVRNIYYLLCYAWNHLGSGESVDVDREEFDQLSDLFAFVLTEGVSRLIARGLDRSYLAHEDLVEGVKGKLNLSLTLKTNSLRAARTHCIFDELTHDIEHNRILKSTLRRVAQCEGVDRQLRGTAADLYARLDSVSDVGVSPRSFRTVQLHRNNRFYRFLLGICQLIAEQLIVSQETGRTTFRDFREDEARMGALFEDFVRNFLRREQNSWSVSSPTISWHEATGSERALGHLPDMRTDIVLDGPSRRLIIDTKFYAEPLAAGRFGQSGVRSGHLYQIFAYVENEAARDPRVAVEGMLLYASVDRDFRFEYELKGHRIQVRSLNLDQSWRNVHRDILDICEVSPSPSNSRTGCRHALSAS